MFLIMVSSEEPHSPSDDISRFRRRGKNGRNHSETSFTGQRTSRDTRVCAGLSLTAVHTHIQPDRFCTFAVSRWSVLWTATATSATIPITNIVLTQVLVLRSKEQQVQGTSAEYANMRPNSDHEHHADPQNRPPTQSHGGPDRQSYHLKGRGVLPR